MRERFFVAFNYACMAGNPLPRQKTGLNLISADLLRMSALHRLLPLARAGACD